MEVTMVRVYLTEGDKLINAIISYLHDEINVKGVTVFRAVTGFGQSGAIHSSDLLTMSTDLPLIVEFFDSTEKTSIAISRLHELVGPGHVVSWPAKLAGNQ